MGSGSWSKKAYATYAVNNNLSSSSINTTFNNTSIDCLNSVSDFNIDPNKQSPLISSIRQKTDTGLDSMPMR